MESGKEFKLIKSSRIFDSKGNVSVEHGAILVEDDARCTDSDRLFIIIFNNCSKRCRALVHIESIRPRV